MTPEAQNIEWKSSWRDEYLAWICGFANAQGGVSAADRRVRVGGVIETGTTRESPDTTQNGDAAAGGTAGRAMQGTTRKTTRRQPENNQKTVRKPPENRTASQKLADRIVFFLRQNPSASRRQIAESLGTAEGSVRHQIEKLKRSGTIRRVRPDKGGHWEVLDDTVAEPVAGSDHSPAGSP